MTGEGGVIRVLLGWTGGEGRDRQAQTFANALRDSGMDVVFTGFHPNPDSLVRAAIQEDVSVICVPGDGADIERALEAEKVGGMTVVSLTDDIDAAALVRAAASGRD